MKLTIKTTNIFKDVSNPHKIIMLRGGARSSKTYTAVQYLIVQALTTPNTTCSIVRKSFPSIRISVLRDFISIMKDLNLWEDNRFVRTRNLYEFENGSIIEFISVADAERIKGSKRNYLLIDEANELSYEEFQQLFIRTINKVILAFNPNFNKDTHWLYTTVYHHPDCREFISTYRNNKFLEEEIILELERLETISPSYYRIYALGEFGSAEGLVFDNFSVIDQFPEDTELICYGMDLGFTNDETAIVGIFKTKDVNTILVKELCYQKGMLTDQIANKLKEYSIIYGKARIYSDVDNRLITELQRYGLDIKASKKGPNSIQLGIDVMKQYKILALKKDKNMVNELWGYVFQKDKNGDLTNIPSETNNHLIDAFRYSVFNTLSMSNKKKSGSKLLFM